MALTVTRWVKEHVDLKVCAALISVKIEDINLTWLICACLVTCEESSMLQLLTVVDSVRYKDENPIPLENPPFIVCN